MHVLNTRKLAEDLAHGRVSEREKAYYLLGGWLLYTALGYSTLTFSNQGRTWLGLYEFVLVAIIAIFGIQRCYEASSGDSSRHFVVDFTCLLVPLSIKIYAVVWGLYWLLVWPYWAVLDISFSGEDTVRLVNFFLRNVGWLATLVAVLATQIILFLRMRVHMSHIAKLRETSNNAFESGPPSAAAQRER